MRTVTLMLFGGLLIAGLGAAQQAESPWELLSTQHDKNGDGKITPAEYTRGKERFRRLDRNGDGVITSDDIGGGGRGRGRRRGGNRNRRRPRSPKTVLARLLGLRGDAKMTRDGLSAWVKRHDGNGDGAVEPSELEEVFLTRRSRTSAVRTLDADKDGKLAASEITSVFTAADADGDGVVSGSDLGAQARNAGGRNRQRGRRGRGDAAGVPQPGDAAPDFTLPTKDGKSQVTLSAFAGKRPVALIFGSYT